MNLTVFKSAALLFYGLGEIVPYVYLIMVEKRFGRRKSSVSGKLLEENLLKHTKVLWAMWAITQFVAIIIYMSPFIFFFHKNDGLLEKHGFSDQTSGPGITLLVMIPLLVIIMVVIVVCQLFKLKKSGIKYKQ